jgi:uncharacterized membrane protein
MGVTAMAENIRLLFATVIFRPYVFIFLAIYLVAATMKVGAKKAVLFTLSAWAIAYVAEFSSIRNGIPFGLYHYIPSTVNCELWICGVPFMDSLSFTFLAYSSWATARVFMCPAEGKGFSFAFREGYKNRFSIGTVFLGALLFMLIDVVIDPLSLRGDRWFLGKIYYYPDGGAYFGVTISNFIGWFIVGFVTLMVWGGIDRWMPSTIEGRHAGTAPTQAEGNALTPVSPLPRGEGNIEEQPNNQPQVARGIKRYMPSVDLLGPALYMIVLIFNLTMTFYIGETTIGWVGVFIFLPVVFLMGQKIRGEAHT